jgi:peptide-methionine (S)-S-oxide reductase
MVLIKSIFKALKKTLSIYFIYTFLGVVLMAQNKTTTLGGGCFWCVEAVFQRIKGVISVKPGYAGGETLKPTYKQICTGKTGHAEVAQITYDSKIVNFDEILDIFWISHDPTTLNRQGNDVGTQYRSVIFYHNEDQKVTAIASKNKTNQKNIWNNEIVTEITALNNYTDAEDYHDNYYNDNMNQPYCVYVIKPKIDKLKRSGIIK